MGIEYLSEYNLEEALAFAERSHADSAWKDYPFKREVLRRNLVKMIARANYFTCLYRKDGELVGYWFAALQSFLFSDKLVGSENGIYIVPEQRGYLGAVCMWREFKAWCDRNGVEPLAEVQFGNAESNEKAYAFFEKLGMVECGRIFRGGK